MSALLEAKSLRAGYGRVPILHGIDLSVSDGEIVGVLGHNGMGKTTLLKTLMGIVPATAGSINYSGMDVTRNASSQRAKFGIGYVPQGRGIFPNLTVYDNIRMGVAGHGLDEEEAMRRILVEFPRLDRLLDREGGALSGGEQQCATSIAVAAWPSSSLSKASTLSLSFPTVCCSCKKALSPAR